MFCPLFMKGQSNFFTFLNGENFFRTESKEASIHMTMNDDIQCLSITIRYKDIHYLEETHSEIHLTLPYSNIDNFKSEIKLIERKFKEWENVAKTNDVKDFKKEMPVSISISNFRRMNCDHLAEPSHKEIKTIFDANYGTPVCNIQITLSGYNVIQKCEMHLKDYEISKLYEEIDKTIEIHKKNINESKQKEIERKKTDDLFH